MATSLAIIILLGLLSNKLFEKFKLPGLLGMIIVGILIGPFGFDLLSDEIIRASADFRKIALIVILLRAGLGIKKEDLKNVALALAAGFKGILLISIGLIARSIGVMLSLIGTELNMKEKLFCILAYIPKATVQAAIGATPLSMGVESGDLILSLAVLSIIITAPLGAIAIKVSGHRLLER